MANANGLLTVAILAFCFGWLYLKIRHQSFGDAIEEIKELSRRTR